jgi:hypothetical protein
MVPPSSRELQKVNSKQLTGDQFSAASHCDRCSGSRNTIPSFITKSTFAETLSTQSDQRI